MDIAQSSINEEIFNAKHMFCHLNLRWKVFPIISIQEMLCRVVSGPPKRPENNLLISLFITLSLLMMSVLHLPSTYVILHQ